jgi:hypothetical protein
MSGVTPPLAPIFSYRALLSIGTALLGPFIIILRQRHGTETNTAKIESRSCRQNVYDWINHGV